MCESVNRDHSSHLAHQAFTQVRLQLSDAIAKAASAIFSRHFVYGKFPNSYPTYPGGTPPPQTLRVNQRPALPKSAAQIRSRECLQADIKGTKYLFPKKCVSKVEWTFFEGTTIQLINYTHVFHPWSQRWPCGLMDKASDFGSEDCRFESCHGRRWQISPHL